MRYLSFFLPAILLCCNQKPETTTDATAPDSQPEPISEQTTASDSTIYSFGYDPIVSLSKAEANTIPTDTSQILSFDKPGAIPVYPDTAEINRLQKEDMNAYETVLDDYIYYESLALDTLKSQNILIHDGGIIDKRYYKFKLSGDRIFYVDMFKVRDFGIILYNAKDVPLFVSPMSVADIMDSVFRK